MEHNMDNSNNEMFKKCIDNCDRYEERKIIYDILRHNISVELEELKDYIISRNI